VYCWPVGSGWGNITGMKSSYLNSNKFILVCLVVLIFAVGLACNAVTGGDDEPVEVEVSPVSSLEDTAEPDSLGSLADAIQTFDNLPRGHDENPVYPDTGAPPPGGVHASVWQNCGIYLQPVEAKNVIHSLEHGAVWLTYDPNLSEDEVSILQETVKDQAYTVMSPYPGLRSPVILTAWGVQFETDSVTDPRILEFLLTYQVGPQTPEPGAPCQGGLGAPRAPDSLG